MDKYIKHCLNPQCTSFIQRNLNLPPVFSLHIPTVPPEKSCRASQEQSDWRCWGRWSPFPLIKDIVG